MLHSAYPAGFKDSNPNCHREVLNKRASQSNVSRQISDDTSTTTNAGGLYNRTLGLDMNDDDDKLLMSFMNNAPLVYNPTTTMIDEVPSTPQVKKERRVKKSNRHPIFSISSSNLTTDDSFLSVSHNIVMKKTSVYCSDDSLFQNESSEMPEEDGDDDVIEKGERWHFYF